MEKYPAEEWAERLCQEGGMEMPSEDFLIPRALFDFVSHHLGLPFFLFLS